MRKCLPFLLFCFLLVGICPPTFGQAPSTIRSGPMVGYSAMREVMLWIQTTKAARVQIRYWDEKAPNTKKTSEAVATTSAESFTAHIPISYLEPSTKYGYEVLLDGKLAARPYPLHFQTQTLWQYRTDPPAFTVAFGSCAYINDTPYDRPGTPYGKDTKIFLRIAEQKPDMMLWLGDNMYYREPDFDSKTMMDYRYAHDRAIADLQPLLGNTHHYAIWDDHDYGPNDSDRGYVLKYESLDLFKRYWANPTYGFRDNPGVFGQFTWGDADFFLVDNRFHRSPDAEPDGPDKTSLGKEQMQWLIDALTTSKAPFKFIAIGGQVLNEYRFYEDYAMYPQEREYLLNEIVKRKIEGVIFLTGDRHKTELLKYQPDGFYPMYDYTNSPLTSGFGNDPRENDNKLRVPNTLFVGQTFGTLSFSGPRTDRTLTMKAFDLDGKVQWTHVVKANDLKVPK